MKIHGVPFSMVLVFVLASSACRRDESPAVSRTSDAANAHDASANAGIRPAATAFAADTSMRPPQDAAVEFYSAALLAHMADELAKGSTSARTVNAHPRYHTVQARRAANGVPEVHDHVVDVTIVQAGHATLLTGTHVEGSRVTMPGEHRGGTIVGGQRRQLAPGDFFIIAAGTPHQYLISTGDSIRYLTIKVLEADGRARSASGIAGSPDAP